MELPLYVWRPDTNFRRRKRRPWGEILRDVMAWLGAHGWHGAAHTP